MIKRPDHDLIVVGGGVAGLACAIAARREGLDVLVVEKSGLDDWRAGEHLPPDATACFDRLNCTAVLHAPGHARCHGTVSIWGSSEQDRKDYLFNPYGEGFNLARPAFDQALADTARSAGAKLLLNTKLTGLEKRCGLWTACVQDSAGSTCRTTAVIVDATGRPATVAKKLGAHRRQFDNLVGLVGRTPPVGRSDMSVTIEAVEHGWWYAVGMADGSLTATFMTDRDCAALSPGGRVDTWRAALLNSTLTRSRHAALQTCTELVLRSASSGRLDRIAGDGWLAVGDAAFSVDPLSSEGITKASAWGLEAAEAIAAHRGGNAEALSSYHQRASEAFANYLLMRYRYYAVERRWPDSLFWARRHRAPAPVGRRAARS